MNALGLHLVQESVPTFLALRSTPETLEALTRRRLTRLLQYVARSNRFYAERLRQAGIEATDPLLQADPYRVLAALPPVSKAELRDALPSVLDGGRIAPGWYSSASSGSTGEPFRVYYEPRAWAILKHLVKLRARYACGFRPYHRIALLDTAGDRSGQEAAWWARWGRVSVLQPPHRITRWLSDFAPDMVFGLASALLEAGRIIERDGFSPSLRAVFTSGELLQGSTRRSLSELFRAPVFDVYGTSETKEIGWECLQGAMHRNSDVVHLEVLDEWGRNLPPGSEGDLVATVLVNRAMPLLRYRTGDRGSLLAGNCTCGSPLPLLGVVTGRLADMLVLRGGQRISSYALTSAIERVPGVVRYQVSQLDPSRLRVRAILEGAANRSVVAAEMRNVLRLEVAPFLETDLEVVERFPAGTRTKFRVVEPMA